MRFSLTAWLGLNKSGFDNGMRDAGRKVGALKSQFAALKGRIAAAFTIGYVANFTSKVIQNGAKIREWAQRLGVGVERVQELDYALKQNSNTLDELLATYNALERARQRALDGDANVAGDFEKLGISLDQLRTSNIDQLFVSIAENIRKAGEDTAWMGDSLLNVAGRNATKMMGTIQAGLVGLAQELHDIGGVIDEEIILKLKDVDGQLLQIKARFGPAFASAVIKMVEGLRTLLWNLKEIGMQISELYAKATFNKNLQSKIAQDRADFEKEMVQTFLRDLNYSDRNPGRPGPPPSLSGDGGTTNIPAAAGANRINFPTAVVNDSLVKVGNFLLGQRSMMDVEKDQLYELKQITRNTRDSGASRSGWGVPST